MSNGSETWEEFVYTVSLKKDTCYLAIGPVLLQGILIGQPQARAGYKLHPVPLITGENHRRESLRTGKEQPSTSHYNTYDLSSLNKPIFLP
jgi:hypothetical protein